MSVHSLNRSRTADPVVEAKIHLAAAHRLAVLHGLEEGIDNHFTVTVPGTGDRYLVLPFGQHWSEARASDLFVFDETGRTLEGEGVVELSAQCIHAPVHRITGARVVLHTHQTWALALNMLDDNRLVPASQTAAFFHDRVAYDDDYAGTADIPEEGERLARLIGDKHTLFMKNHGVVVVGGYGRAGVPPTLHARARVSGTGAGDEHWAAARAARRRDRRPGAGTAGAGPSPARRARATVFRRHDAGARSRASGLRRLGGSP